MYDLLKFVHIACAIIWVGGALYAQLLAMRTARSGDPSDNVKLGRSIEFIGTRVFLPASIVLFVVGLILTAQRWSFSSVWISIAMLLWLVSALAGSLYLGPNSKRVADIFETEGPRSSRGMALLNRLYLVSRLELVSFAIVVALMVFKPMVSAA